MALTDHSATSDYALLPGPEAWEGGLISDEFLDTLVALFNTYDRRERFDLHEELRPSVLDREIFYDLLEGPAAPYVDVSRSDAEDQVIAFIDGSAARRRPGGEWERVSLDQTTFFHHSLEIRVDLHELT